MRHVNCELLLSIICHLLVIGTFCVNRMLHCTEYIKAFINFCEIL